jgi:hypothetical protein
MIHIKSYSLYESLSEEISLIKICDSLLNDSSIWKGSKKFIDPHTVVFIDTRGKRTSEAHFNRTKSTRKRIVIQMSSLPDSRKEMGTLAHEIVHALQWLTGTEGDLMFITDVTRDIDSFSDSVIWKKLIYSIYLSCPQETEAWEAESSYSKAPILAEILPWMKSFNPSEVASELVLMRPRKNQWGMTSFSQLPEFWSEAYIEYGEVKAGSEIPDLAGFTLEEFLSYYNEKFKATCYVLQS